MKQLKYRIIAGAAAALMMGLSIADLPQNAFPKQEITASAAEALEKLPHTWSESPTVVSPSFSAEGYNPIVSDAVDQIVVAGDAVGDLRIGHADVPEGMSVGAADTGQAVLFRQLPGQLISQRLFAGVEDLYKVHLAQQLVIGTLEAHHAGGLDAEGMSRSADPAKGVDQGDQPPHAHAPDPEDGKVHAVGHDDQDVAGVLGVVLHAADDGKILELLPVLRFFHHPVPCETSPVTVVVRDHESIVAQDGEPPRVGLHGDFGIQ